MTTKDHFANPTPVPVPGKTPLHEKDGAPLLTIGVLITTFCLLLAGAVLAAGFGGTGPNDPLAVINVLLIGSGGGALIATRGLYRLCTKIDQAFLQHVQARPSTGTPTGSTTQP